MERIQQALERARQEQAARKPAPDARPRIAEARDVSDSQPVTAETLGHAVPESQISYSLTQVVKAVPEALKRNRIVAGNDSDPAATAYKMLRTQVLQKLVEKGWNALAITSPGMGNGKTLTAINLAISLAREVHHTVLLGDLDMRHPSIHTYFGLTPEFGISDFLLRDVPMQDILINPGIERLVLLPGREVLNNSSELLASPKMAKLVSELKSRYPSRIVIFDLPPILSADDALAFAPHVDAALLVIEDGKTTRAEVEHALSLMRNTSLLGTVLNKSSVAPGAYY
ncbi:MAG: CpsD/CapB family tyrosine-protein kinase [Gammaproteobacteria bacterium]